MKVQIEFEDNDNIYNVDFFKLVKLLKITEEQVIHAVQELLSKG
jgi:hypothetical protein